MEGLRKAAGIKVWPHNVLRHSFGSYHLAAYGDGVRTAAQMSATDRALIWYAPPFRKLHSVRTACNLRFHGLFPFCPVRTVVRLQQRV